MFVKPKQLSKDKFLSVIHVEVSYKVNNNQLPLRFYVQEKIDDI